MKKPLELDEVTARRLYPTVTPEFKELLEHNFGKEFFKQKITDRIKNYQDVLDVSGTCESDDEAKIKGFDEAENKVLKAVIRKMRITKVYREGWFPKRGERRYYPYFDVSSGFVFNCTTYVVTFADSTSASHLCLPSDETTRDYASKFIDVERDLIDLP